ASSYRGGSLTAWADRIAVRTAARQARKRRVRAAREISAVEEALGSIAPGMPAEHSIPRPLLEYLGELPETRRTVLVLRHVLEYSIAEVAEITESSPNTVKDRRVTARAQIRRAVRREINRNSSLTGGRERGMTSATDGQRAPIAKRWRENSVSRIPSSSRLTWRHAPPARRNSGFSNSSDRAS